MQDLIPHPQPAFTLRQLPLPAKLVLTAFLLAVGLGYTSAMLQLHFKHASPGEKLPTEEDVVAHFAGSDWPPTKAPPKEEEKKEEKKDAAPAGPKQAAIKIKSLIETRCAVCHGEGGEEENHPLAKYDQIAKYMVPQPGKGLMHKLITGPEDAWKKDVSMSPAFFRKSEGWKDVIKERGEEVVRKERETERLAMAAWLEAGASEEAYNADGFVLPPFLVGKELTAEFKTEAVKVEEKKQAPKKRDAKSRQTSVEGLTQSTHAHLLTFSLLWTATGLIFAFTDYRKSFRMILSPLVLVAQVADIACWWLARIPGVGPYFAFCIIGTGGMVAIGLLLQITLSLLNMYDRRGKRVILAFFLVIGAALGAAYVTYMVPQLAEEKKGLEGK